VPSPRQARARATDTDKKTECRDGSDGRQSPGTPRMKDALLASRPYALLHLHQPIPGAHVAGGCVAVGDYLQPRQVYSTVISLGTGTCTVAGSGTV
jgi:hypothetical protein